MCILSPSLTASSSDGSGPGSNMVIGYFTVVACLSCLLFLNLIYNPLNESNFNQFVLLCMYLYILQDS